MSKCKSVEPIVFEVLREVPETRADDFLLVYEVYARFLGTDIDRYTFNHIMHHHKDLGLPHFESIRRSRPKLQNKYPELLPSEEVQQAREELEDDYRDYALYDE